MDKAKNTQLAENLLTKTLELLLKRVEEGTATAAEITAAHKYIASSGVEMNATPTNPMGALAGALQNLPFAGSDGPSH